jgi:cellulose synthase/poly-beta-1,6-N-acetylglucosamine synthase-like glycosyltransferase
MLGPGVAVFYLFLYGLCTLALLLSVLSLVEGFRAVRHLKTYRPHSSATPRVVVFCPCKGIDPGFRENAESILKQDYPFFRVVFILESLDDPSAVILKELGAQVSIAGFAERRGQKVHNLIHGLTTEAGDAEVLVFCDADARFPREWIRNLIAPLDADNVAVSSGYRWYAAESGTAASVARSMWNASSVTLLGSHGRNFAWGGSMALRRDVFERIGVRRAWEHALSDDWAVTRAARSAGMKVVFVPLCLVPSYGDTTWRELLEFTTRQVIITRVYEPRVWRLAFFGQTVFNAAFWGGLLLPGWGKLMTAALFVLSGAKSYIRYHGVASVLPAGALSKKRTSYILWAPLTALLFEYNLIRSALTRNITWRQVHYRLRSPDCTEVRRGASGS